jgi:GMP synthase-like glutamine amidotransferase
MKICVLQHAVSEGPGEIATWAELRGHEVSVYQLYRGEHLPRFDSFDMLVVMGGEMNIYQYRFWPWLKPEREFIKATLDKGKPVVGICLGAQFIADALGARAVQNAEVELGWWPVTWTNTARAVFPELPASSTVLHWHGDTFELPAGAIRLGLSEGCPQQGFVIKDKCLALQFHLEVNPDIVADFVKSQDEWPEGPLVQTQERVQSEAASHYEKDRALLHSLLDRFCGL